MDNRPERIFDFTVDHRDIPRPGGKAFVALNPHTHIGVLHTTEGNSLEKAFTTLKGNFSPPHFIG